jgi:3-hydroxybutyryl-CoA dehydrogenase
MRLEDVHRVSTIGFGLMGSQISQLFAQNGFEVFAFDSDDGATKVGLERIRNGPFGLETAARKGKIDSDEIPRIMERIKIADSLKEAAMKGDLVIEAAAEESKTKKDIFRQLGRFTKKDAVLASNSSTLSITELAGASNRPAETVGLHFFNPPQVMKLVEIVRGLFTSDETTILVRRLAEKMSKQPIIVKDSPGFVTTRLGLALFTEASKVLAEGVASVRDIDLAMRLGYGHTMGPFELTDLIGLDARLKNLEALYGVTHDEKWKPPTLLKQLVESGFLGDPLEKPSSRGGYYEYFRLTRPRDEKSS